MKNSEEKRSNRRRPAKGADNEAGKPPDNREKILATALTLFTERGFFGTPTSLISKEAGVATGTLFFYFPTKEELIDTLYRRIKSEAAKGMCRDFSREKTALAKLRRIGFNAVEWGIENPARQKFMEQFAHSPFVSTNCPRGRYVPLPFPKRTRFGRDPRGHDPEYRPGSSLLYDGLVPLRPDRTGVRGKRSFPAEKDHRRGSGFHFQRDKNMTGKNEQRDENGESRG